MIDPLLVGGIIIGSIFIFLGLFLFTIARVLQALDYDVYDAQP